MSLTSAICPIAARSQALLLVPVGCREVLARASPVRFLQTRRKLAQTSPVDSCGPTTIAHNPGMPDASINEVPATFPAGPPVSLYRVVEDGMTDLDHVLDRLKGLKSERDRVKAALGAAKSHGVADIRIDPALIESFGRTMRENLTSGS